jgi:hypothetical protein
MAIRVSKVLERFRAQTQHLAGARMGADTTNATTFSSTGRSTQAGMARNYKEIFIAPKDFRDSYAGGDITIASLMLNVTASIFAGTAGSQMAVDALTASGGAVGGTTCPRYTCTMVPVPLDAATSGSIQAFIDYTAFGTPAFATTGCMVEMHVGLAYLRSGTANSDACVVRTAACVKVGACYPSTTCGLFATASLPYLPSFGATDKLVAISVGMDGASTTGASTSATSGSSWAILGIRLRYLTDKLGTVSSE